MGGCGLLLAVVVVGVERCLCHLMSRTPSVTDCPFRDVSRCGQFQITAPLIVHVHLDG